MTKRHSSKQDQPRVLLAASMWWPLAARLAMALLRHGYCVETVCPPGHPLRYVTGISRRFCYNNLFSLDALRTAIEKVRPEQIIPCDDGVVWQLHALHRQHRNLRPLIERSLGAPEGYATIQSRARLLDLACSLGIRVPETRTIAAEAEILDLPWTSPQVLKLNGTWGGNGVEIAHTPADAVAAFRRLSQPLGAAVMLKRLLINCEPLVLWMFRQHQRPLITMQHLVEGRPANAMIVCRDGEVLATLTVEVLCTLGATGAATVVRAVQNDEIEQAARLLARRLKLNGFHGLDFILERQSNDAYLIELNPRCTQLGHLRLDGQTDLVAAFATMSPRHPHPVGAPIVAFFPQAIKANPANPYLSLACHDVPWKEPALVRCLLEDSWPDRQWQSRLYHFFRPLKPRQEVTFQP